MADTIAPTSATTHTEVIRCAGAIDDPTLSAQSHSDGKLLRPLFSCFQNVVAVSRTASLSEHADIVHSADNRDRALAVSPFCNSNSA